MAVIARSICVTAAKVLQDDTNIAYPLDELLAYLNMGQRELVLGKPDAYVKNESIPLVAGTRQSIPADGNVFMRITRMMGANGTTPGIVPRPIPMNVLDEQKPSWHTDPANASAQHFAYDDRDKRHFYVYPPQPATPSQAEIIYSATPPEVTIDQPLAVSDLYQSALLDYVLYRAYSKDAEYTRNDAKATAYYQTFGALLSVKTNGEAKNDASNNAIGNQRAGKKA